MSELNGHFIFGKIIGQTFCPSVAWYSFISFSQCVSETTGTFANKPQL